MERALPVIVLMAVLSAGTSAAQPVLSVTLGSSTGTSIPYNQSPAGTARDFGNQDILAGPTAAITIYITNQGNTNLSLTTPDMGGTWWAQYVVNPTGMVNSLAPSQSCFFTVAFDPLAAGQKDAHVRFAHTDSGQPTPYYIPVTGVGTIIAPVISVALGSPTGTPISNNQSPTGTPRDFGSQDIAAGATAPITLYVTNTGTATLTLTTPDLGGAWPTEYFLNTAGMLSTLTIGQSTSFAVFFDPNSAGTKDAYVRIPHSSVSQPSPFLVPVTGIGTTGPLPQMQLFAGASSIQDGGVHNAGPRTAGSANQLSFTIANTGTATLDLTGTPLVELSNNVVCMATVTAQPATSQIAASGSTTFTVDVVPSLHAPWSFQLSIANTDLTRDPYNVTIQGTGVVIPTELRITTQPVDGNAGQAFVVPPFIAITDANGLVRTDDNFTQVLVTITPGTGSTGATLTGTTSATAVGGYVQFSDLAIDRGGTGYTLTFTSTNVSLAGAVSDPFDIVGSGGGNKGGDSGGGCSTGEAPGSLILVLMLVAASTLLIRQRVLER